MIWGGVNFSLKSLFLSPLMHDRSPDTFQKVRRRGTFISKICLLWAGDAASATDVIYHHGTDRKNANDGCCVG